MQILFCEWNDSATAPAAAPGSDKVQVWLATCPRTKRT